MFLIVLPEVQTDELAVPFEGDVVMHCGLTEDVSHIFFFKGKQQHSKTKRGIFQMNVVTRSFA